MATTLTALAPTLFSAAQVVSGESAGVLDAINNTWDDKGVAKGDSVLVPYAPVQTTDNFSASNVLPEGDTNVAAAVTVKITQSKKTKPMVLTGEQIRSLENGGNYQEWVRQWAEQSMRALRNLAEAEAAEYIKQGASRAIGTAGTTPFATDLDLIVDVKKILRDNGCPFSDPQLVINSAAAANLQKLGIYQQAYAAGTDEERRSGLYKPQFGFIIRDSAGIVQHVKGALTSTTSDNDAAATLAKGTLSVNCDTNTTDGDTVKAGDIITWAGDTNKYVIATAIASAADNMSVVMNRPGLRETLASGVLGTLGASYTPLLAFERSAIVGIMRPPLMPANPVIKTMPVSDRFGHSYLMVEIAQYGQIVWEMHLAYGFKVVQPEHVAMILG
jgi:hypothetical protein